MTDTLRTAILTVVVTVAVLWLWFILLLFWP